jgi:hypothetical protein
VWEGELAGVQLGLQMLLAQLDRRLGENTYEWWPSGMRYALAIADSLGEGWFEGVEELAQRVAAERRSIRRRAGVRV